MPTPTRTHMRWVKLVRISKDRDDQSSIRDQEFELDQYVTHHGDEVVAEFREEGVSGFKHIRRPSLDKAIEMVRIGLADGILVWKMDRFTRQGAIEQFRMIGMVKEGNGCVVAVADDLDTRRMESSDVIIMTIKAELARDESKRKADLANRWHRGRLRDVKPPHGPTPFGYESRHKDSLVVDATEAKTAKRINRCVRAGESLRAIARALNDDGIASKTGAPWTPRTVKLVAVNPTLAGGRLIDGEFCKGKWPTIITQDEWADAHAILTDETRSCIRPEQRKRRWLLTGLATCGRCTGRLIAKPHKDGPRYSCTGCGLSIAVSVADEVAEATTLDALSGDGWQKLRARGRRNDASAVAFLTERMDAAKARWKAGKLSDDDYFELRDELSADIDAIQNAAPVPLPDVPDIQTAWADDDLTIEQKRQVMSIAVGTIRIMPFAPGMTKHDRVIID